MIEFLFSCFLFSYLCSIFFSFSILVVFPFSFSLCVSFACVCVFDHSYM